MQCRGCRESWRPPEASPWSGETYSYYRYIFSLASNPFYLWLICTIFYEAGEGYVPTTLTQLYTWVIIVFSNQWQHAEGALALDAATVTFLRGFAQLCYHLVQVGATTASNTPNTPNITLVLKHL